MTYTFRFYFPDLPESLKAPVEEGWGGNIGTAFNRAWKRLRCKKEYKDIKKLRPANVTIIYPE